MSEKRVDTGVYQTYNARGEITGWRVYVRVNGKLKPKRLSKDMSLGEVNRWRENWTTDLRRAPELPKGAPGTIADDARRYLEAVKTMPTYRERERHILEWVAILGPTRARSEVQPIELETQRERWLVKGPRMVQRRIDGAWQWIAVDEPLSPQSVALRLRAGRNWWTKLDGRHAANPFREVDEPPARPEEARALPADVIDRILAAAPDIHASGTNAIARDPRRRRRAKGLPPAETLTAGVSRTKIRARCMRWTGLAPIELGRVKPHHVNLDKPAVWISPRRKGRRAKKQAPRGRWVPLIPEAVEAFTDFVTYNCFGAFSTSSFHKSWEGWCRKAGYGGLGLRPYDMRHTVGTDVYAATGDLTAAGELLGQSDPRTTKRYSRAALNPKVVEAMAKMREKVTSEVTEARRKRSGTTG